MVLARLFVSLVLATGLGAASYFFLINLGTMDREAYEEQKRVESLAAGTGLLVASVVFLISLIKSRDWLQPIKDREIESEVA